MKVILWLLAGIPSLLYSEIVTLHVKTKTVEEDTYTFSEQSIVLQEGDSAKILSAYSETITSWTAISLEIGGAQVQLPFRTTSFGNNDIAPSWTIAGPATLKAFIISKPENPSKVAFFTASITRATETQTVTAPGVAIIPEDVNGTYNVVLESSTDLISWALANPGSYGGSESRRFFRVRTIKQ